MKKELQSSKSMPSRDPSQSSLQNWLMRNLAIRKALFLILRNNGGGDAEAMAEVASAFLSPGHDLGQFIDRAGASFSISTRGRSMLAARATTTNTNSVSCFDQRTHLERGRNSHRSAEDNKARAESWGQRAVAACWRFARDTSCLMAGCST